MRNDENKENLHGVMVELIKNDIDLASYIDDESFVLEAIEIFDHYQKKEGMNKEYAICAALNSVAISRETGGRL